jgi:hypothetical protein
MQVIKSALLRTPPEHLTDAVVGHHAASPQPQRAVPHEPMLASFSEIALDCLPSLVPEGTGAGSAALPQYDGDVLVKIDICERETGEF